MFVKKEYQYVAETIIRTDWDDNTQVKNNNIIIEQFQGTAFDSDYKCYKVTKKEWIPLGNSLLQGKNVIYELVAKVTNVLETKVLKGLAEAGFGVPKTFVSAKCGNQIIIFEEFMPGQELYSVSEKKAWTASAEALAKIHLEYWDKDLQGIFGLSNEEKNVSIVDFENKIRRAQTNTYHKSEWRKVFKTINERMTNCAKTLVHGDLFSTNILVDGEKVTFIDWANAGEFPYFMDISRLTGMLNKDSGEMICQSPESIYQIYFEILSDKLQIDYEKYIKDVSMGQFVELAATYLPPIGLNAHSIWACSDYNTAVEKRLNKLSAIILA